MTVKQDDGRPISPEPDSEVDPHIYADALKFEARKHDVMLSPTAPRRRTVPHSTWASKRLEVVPVRGVAQTIRPSDRPAAYPASLRSARLSASANRGDGFSRDGSTLALNGVAVVEYTNKPLLLAE